ncbi:amidase, partial [bacterium M00.F.Ca.ET.141.01.1.1]
KTVASAVAGTMRSEAERVGRPVTGEVERATRVLGRLGEMLSAGEVYEGVQRLNATARRLIEETARYDAVLMPIIAHPPLACRPMAPKGADEFIENLLDKL